MIAYTSGRTGKDLVLIQVREVESRNVKKLKAERHARLVEKNKKQTLGARTPLRSVMVCLSHVANINRMARAPAHVGTAAVAHCSLMDGHLCHANY